MPTVIYVGKIRIKIHRKDHPPPHVHVVGPGCEAKFEIGNLICTSSRGFSRQDIRRIRKYLMGHKEYLMEVWNEYTED